MTVALLAVMGTALGPVGPLVMTVLGERTPEALRARVFGAVGTLMNAGIPVGVLLVGVALQGFGLRAILGALAAAYLALCLGVLVLPSFRRLSTLDGALATGEAGPERRGRA